MKIEVNLREETTCLLVQVCITNLMLFNNSDKIFSMIWGCKHRQRRQKNRSSSITMLTCSDFDVKINSMQIVHISTMSKVDIFFDVVLFPTQLKIAYIIFLEPECVFLHYKLPESFLYQCRSINMNRNSRYCCAHVGCNYSIAIWRPWCSSSTFVATFCNL